MCWLEIIFKLEWGYAIYVPVLFAVCIYCTYTFGINDYKGPMIHEKKNCLLKGPERVTLPKTNSSHMKIGGAPKGFRPFSQPPWLSGAKLLLVSGRVYTHQQGGVWRYMDVNPKIGVVKPPKMDGENNGSKPYENG